uniref:Histocompatibility (minor) 13 n=1 Tax=Astyanax mexicanus TaxID=7994 RepID=A0A8B9HFC4_ASTMX
MADIEQGSAAPLPADGAPLQEANGTDALNATAAKFVATAEGTALAYGSLVLMALLPIFFGALRSVSSSKSKNASDMPETITSRDAARFPIIASCTLFGLYLFFKIFSQEYINMLLSMYFFVLGILALSHTMSPFMNRVFPANLPNKQYQLLFTQGSGENKEEIVNYEFDTKDLICLAISSVVGVWYVLKKVQLNSRSAVLNKIMPVHITSNSLLLYLQVFGTNVMVTVAKSFEAPIKLVFPQDLLERGLNASNFAMLGLGDIVIPGNPLLNTLPVFFISQPALLYLVPACVGFPVVVALLKGELTEMFSYESSEEVLPHTPRLTHFPTVSGSPASLANSMQSSVGSSPRRRRHTPSNM